MERLKERKLLRSPLKSKWNSRVGLILLFNAHSWLYCAWFINADFWKIKRNLNTAVFNQNIITEFQEPWEWSEVSSLTEEPWKDKRSDDSEGWDRTRFGLYVAVLLHLYKAVIHEGLLLYVRFVLFDYFLIKDIF